MSARPSLDLSIRTANSRGNVLFFEKVTRDRLGKITRALDNESRHVDALYGNLHLYGVLDGAALT